MPLYVKGHRGHEECVRSSQSIQLLKGTVQRLCRRLQRPLLLRVSSASRDVCEMLPDTHKHTAGPLIVLFMDM